MPHERMHMTCLERDVPWLQASAMTEDERQSESGSNNRGVMPAAVFDITRKGLNALAVSPDGTRLATAARDGTVRIHDLTNGALLAGFRVCSAMNPSSWNNPGLVWTRLDARPLWRRYLGMPVLTLASNGYHSASYSRIVHPFTIVSGHI